MFLHQKADPAGQSIRGFSTSFEGNAVVQFKVFKAESEFFSTFTQSVGNISIPQEGFGWDAANIQTYTTKKSFFNNCGF